MTPQFAAIIRQGVAEGVFTLTQPEQMARVVLSLMLDTGTRRASCTRHATPARNSLDEVRQRISTYESALERVLGVPAGTLHLVEESTLQEWFA